MTYDRVNSYTLGDKMKKQFRGRGASLSGMQASSTSELMRRATMGRDPKVNCSEQAFFDNCKKRAGAGANRSGYRADSVRTAGGARKTGYTASVGNMSNRRTAKTEARKRPAPTPITPSLEVVEPAKSTPYTFILIILVAAVMFMTIIFGIAEVYSSANNKSKLENQYADLKDYAAILELKLEEKNNVEEIERIARDELGMVGEESVQRRYISLSRGEHIEVIEEVEDEAADGVVLSSIFTVLGDFFDIFK